MVRHADAGYVEALNVIKNSDIDSPLSK
jgi:urocanate hydratase